MLRFAVLMALRRTVADWRLQAAAAFGMVLAVTLMASAVVYSNALEETALRTTLEKVGPEEVDLSVSLSHSLSARAVGDSEAYVQEHISGPLAPFYGPPLLLISTSTFYLTGGDQLEGDPTTRPRGTVQASHALAEHVRVLDGRLPEAASGELEVAVDAAGAGLLSLEVGQAYGLLPAVGEGQSALPARVVGIVEALDPKERFWRFGFARRFSDDADDWVTLVMYAHPDALVGTVGGLTPGNATFDRLFPVVVEEVHAADVGTLEHALSSSRGAFFRTWSSGAWSSGMDRLLEQYRFVLVLARVPIFLLAFLAIGVLLYYLYLIAGLMGRLRAPEVALLRSRGASMTQVGLVNLMEGLLLAVPAVVVGPLLAQGLVRLTGTLFPAASGGAGLVLVDLSASVFLLGVLSAVLAVGVLSVTTLVSASRGMVDYRQRAARPSPLPLLQRYYLDFALLGLIGVIWWQISVRGSLLVQTVADGEIAVDFTLLLGPVLGLIAVGLLLFRAFPLALRAIALGLDPVVPAWVAQGLRRVSRDPVPASSILVLLVLATSMGMVAATFTSTLERSQRERALYEAGAPLRVGHDLGRALADGERVAAELADLPGIAEASDVVRVSGPASTVVLAVEPRAFPVVAWARDDFDPDALAPLEEAGHSPPERGVPLPETATGLGLWVQAGSLTRPVRLFARMRDGEGRYFSSAIGAVEQQGWHRVEGPITPIDPDVEVAPPYALHGIWVAGGGRGFRRGVGTGALYFDQVDAVTPSGPVVVTSFQDAGRWHVLEDAGAPDLVSFEPVASVGREGRRSALLAWSQGRSLPPAVYIGGPEAPIPAVVSPSFLATRGVRPGDVVALEAGSVPVPVRIVGSTPYIATLDAEDGPFAVLDLAAFLDYTTARGQWPADAWAEAWVVPGTSGGEELIGEISGRIRALGGSVVEAQVADVLVASRSDDPLLSAGWGGLLALSFITVVLASSSGLILYTYIDTRERSGEFALMRTMGFSRPQVTAVLWFNLALVVVAGVLIGTAGGQWLGQIMLPLLELAEEGKRVTPPMVLETNWLAVAGAYLVLGLAALVTVAALAWAIAHLEVQRLLRAGVE